MNEHIQGVAASPPGHSGSAPSPVPGLGHPASVPNAEDYTTIVVRHKDKDAAKDFVSVAHKSWPFLGDEAATQMTFVSVGDTASVLDAMRMALVCQELGHDERIELALDLEAHCFTWDECLAYAASEWDLGHTNGQFVAASGIEGEGEDPKGLHPEGESPVAKPDAQ